MNFMNPKQWDKHDHTQDESEENLEKLLNEFVPNCLSRKPQHGELMTIRQSYSTENDHTGLYLFSRARVRSLGYPLFVFELFFDIYSSGAKKILLKSSSH